MRFALGLVAEQHDVADFQFGWVGGLHAQDFAVVNDVKHTAALGLKAKAQAARD